MIKGQLYIPNWVGEQMAMERIAKMGSAFQWGKDNPTDPRDRYARRRRMNMYGP